MLRVADVMRRHVYQAAPNVTVRAAAQELIAHSIESLLVVEEDRVVGIVTERDLLSAILPSVEELMRSDTVTGFSDLLAVARERHDVPLEKVMTRTVQTISPTVTITKALGTMLSHRLRRLPVVEPSSGELVGVITQRDLLSVVFLGGTSTSKDPSGPARIVVP